MTHIQRLHVSVFVCVYVCVGGGECALACLSVCLSVRPKWILPMGRGSECHKTGCMDFQLTSILRMLQLQECKLGNQRMSLSPPGSRYL